MLLIQLWYLMKSQPSWFLVLFQLIMEPILFSQVTNLACNLFSTVCTVDNMPVPASFTSENVKIRTYFIHTSLKIPKTNCQASSPTPTWKQWKRSIYLQKLFGVLWEWHCILNAECLWPCNGDCSPMSGLRVLCPSVWPHQRPTGNDMTPWRQAGRTAAHTRTPPVLMSLTSSVCAGRPSDEDGPAYACECRESVNQSPRWPVPRRGLHTLLSLLKHTYTHTRMLNSTASVWTLRRGETKPSGSKQKCVSVPLSAGEQRIPLKKAWHLKKPGLALTRLNPAEKEWLFQSARFVFLPAP